MPRKYKDISEKANKIRVEKWKQKQAVLKTQTTMKGYTDEELELWEAWLKEKHPELVSNLVTVKVGSFNVSYVPQAWEHKVVFDEKKHPTYRSPEYKDINQAKLGK